MWSLRASHQSFRNSLICEEVIRRFKKGDFRFMVGILDALILTKESREKMAKSETRLKVNQKRWQT